MAVVASSLLYLGLMIPAVLVFPSNFGLAIGVSSVAGGCLFALILWLLLRRFSDPDAQVSHLFGAVALPLLLPGIDYLTFHFLTGLDTTFAMAYVSLYYWLCKCQESAPGGLRWYVGSVVPLPFFAKATNLYGSDFSQLPKYRISANLRYALLFLRQYWYHSWRSPLRPSSAAAPGCAG